MDERKLKGQLGLCVRAGQAVFGEDACLKAMRDGKAGLLILDGEISDGAGERYEALGKREGIPVVRIRPGLLWESTGKPGKAMVVRAGGFTEPMLRSLETEGPARR
ncbi:MAG: hypothetical protein IKE24_04635 [Clostridia bacterium]|nr:hypothetical protein [Clostridia bacterium]